MQQMAFSGPDPHPHDGLRSRLVRSYRSAFDRGKPHETSMWRAIQALNTSVHDAIMSGDFEDGLFDDPSRSHLFYGFDNLCLPIADRLRTHEDCRIHIANWTTKVLHRLAHALGIDRVPNPESIAAGHPSRAPMEADAILDAVSDAIGYDIDFPNPFPDEFGIATRRGIASERALQAIYQAWRIRTLSECYGDRVLEVGAGLGRTVYYAHRMGVKHITIIDLPMTNISQANFLGRVLPPETISLYGENRSAAISILPVSSIEDVAFDLMVNIDSLTEMDAASMRTYAAKAMEGGAAFWSINHEANAAAVHEIEALRGRRRLRFPYWLRDGYTEELFLSAKGRRERDGHEPGVALN